MPVGATPQSRRIKAALPQFPSLLKLVSACWCHTCMCMRPTFLCLPRQIDTGKTFRESVLRWFPRHDVASLDGIVLSVSAQ
jgi:hypothetical protein